MLLVRRADTAGLEWAGSWNLPATGPLAPDHPLVAAMMAGACLQPSAALLAVPPLDRLRPWLAVPLTARDGALAGCILLAQPRGAFRLDDEVSALLRVLAREVTTYLAEQQATRSLLETRDLRVYAERFAFVAHDIKNVAGQLRLLTANADRHMADPAFQRDVLATVDASVRKIGNLIQRLKLADPPDAPGVTTARPAAIPLLPRLHAALGASRPATVQLDPHGPGDVRACIDPADLDSVLTHLLDNAARAAGPEGDVQIGVERRAGSVVVEITDTGAGMTPEFVRDELFRPFSTRAAGGSGIGAFQARALLRRAGGELVVLSEPGQGTTMRIVLPGPPPDLARLPDAVLAS